MRIACLQFAPQVGDVDNNLNRADALLSKANPQHLDLLVLPELAFSGYNFKSLQHISPYLEPTTSGITSLWARTTALKYECVVTVGYPEKVDVTPKWPASPEYYNSAITVNADGETIANYRKSFLYYTDETWALEGPDGFFDGEIEGLGNIAMGICKWPTKSFERMDLNPYKFEAPWSAWEFAYHILHKEANLVILSMAWLTREDARSYSRTPRDPDMDTLSYWLARMEPLIRAETEGEIIVVFANRTGTEDEAVYAGTSAVLGIHAGEVKVYGILGRGEKELLVVDTNKRPQAKLISQPNTAISASKSPKASDKPEIAEKPVNKGSADLRESAASSISTVSKRDSTHSSTSIITNRSDITIESEAPPKFTAPEATQAGGWKYPRAEDVAIPVSSDLPSSQRSPSTPHLLTKTRETSAEGSSTLLSSVPKPSSPKDEIQPETLDDQRYPRQRSGEHNHTTKQGGPRKCSRHRDGRTCSKNRNPVVPVRSPKQHEKGLLQSPKLKMEIPQSPIRPDSHVPRSPRSPKHSRMDPYIPLSLQRLDVGDFPLSMADVISPLSPVDAGSPNAYFANAGRRTEGETLRGTLESSSTVNQFEFISPQPISPTFRRPESPKSRNCSRTRPVHNPQDEELAHDLSYLAIVDDKINEGIFEDGEEKPKFEFIQDLTRVKSPGSRAISPALRTANSKSPEPKIKTPPHSADMVSNNQHSSFPETNVSLSPRLKAANTSPRPRSTIW